MVGDRHRGHEPVRTPPVGDLDLGHRHHPVARAHPTHHGLVGGPDVQRVVSAELEAVAPAQLAAGIRESLGPRPVPGLEALQLHREHFADIAFVDQPLEHVVEPIARGCGNQLAHEVGMALGGLQHLPGLPGGVRHPALAEHVLSAFERGERDCAVHVGPGADQDRFDVFVLEQLPPVRVGARDAELVGHAPARFQAPVRHREDLALRLTPETGDLDVPDVGAGADQSHADGVLPGPLRASRRARRRRGQRSCGERERAARGEEVSPVHARGVGLAFHGFVLGRRARTIGRIHLTRWPQPLQARATVLCRSSGYRRMIGVEGDASAACHHRWPAGRIPLATRVRRGV